MEVFFVYLWLKIDTMRISGMVLASVLIPSISFTYLVNIPASYEHNYRALRETYKAEWAPKTKRWLLGLSAVFVISGLAPSSKETAILLGTSYAVAFAKSPEGAKIGTLIRKKANQYLDEQLKELDPPANKAGNPN